jgi:two-component system, NarL family, sensor histidine kinase UhpB
MTLRLKINLIVSLLTVLFMLAVTGLQLRSMRESVSEETVAANRVAAQLLNRTAWRHAAQGTPAMLAFLQGIGRIRSNDITLFDTEGRELYVSPPSPYKAGREAPPWFERLIAPAPAAQSIAFPDGRLVVRANASRAVLDAWDDLAWLLGSGLVTLLLINALVFALVGRAVRPLGRIASALGEVERGRFDVALPPLPGREAATIGAAFNRMVGQLQANLETERRALRAETQLSDSRELTRWIDQHLEQERHVIARELHDELGQSVTGMRSIALSIAQRAGDAETERAARLIADEASRLYDAMHGMIPRLTPLVLDSFGLAEALADLVERTRAAHPGLAVDVQVEPGEVPLPAEAALALYRAAQEGLTNAIRHGEARHVALVLRPHGGGLRLTVTDDGKGLPAGGTERSGHYGLRWLAERVQGLGGRIELAAAGPAGARLDVQLPLAAEAR